MSTETALDLSAVLSSVEDSELTEAMAEVIALPTKRRNVRGRAALATESTCVLHGGTEDAPCNKFAHLPGDGRGPYAPSLTRRSRAFLIGFIKPMVILSFVGMSLFGAKVFLPRIFHFGSLVPKAPAVVPSQNPAPGVHGNTVKIPSPVPHVCCPKGTAK
jgi:hypothetical protein